MKDVLLDPQEEVAIRQHLALVALAKRPADRVLRVGRLLEVHGREWLEDQEIVIAGKRIAWVGPAGAWPGEAAERVHRPDLAAVPGFGEAHKHIESTHLTPEWDAAMVLPRGCTWTCEASHEFANVNGPRNLEFWLKAREAGMPNKIFPLPGSAVPPTAYEHGGGWFGHDEQAGFMQSPMVAGLDEVMDWPAVWNPENPAYERLWGMIGATLAGRGVVEGHAAGLTALGDINAFAAAGLAGDHEGRAAAEVREKLRRGIFIEVRPQSMVAIFEGLLAEGQEDWSQFALITDDRSASDTLRMGATDHNVRLAVSCGIPVEVAIQMVTINPARHMRLTPYVGSISPGRFADAVLLSDVGSLEIAEVWADGQQVSDGTRYIGPMARIDWPDWATQTVNLPQPVTAADFAIPAPEGRQTVTAAILRPFHWYNDFLTAELPVEGGLAQRDSAQKITKFAIVDRYSGGGEVAKMFWKGTGPATPATALACSVAHDKHNIWAVGSSDEAMAMAVNAIREMQGGWALVVNGEVTATVRYEVGGLMSARPAEELDAEMQALYRAAEAVDWMWEPTATENWPEGFPERLAFATLTCAPWRWVLVAPGPLAPEGFVNVTTGQTHPVVW
ncbi:adenine deaminase [Pseudoroseicyclus tamaricis]|uniref:Adenine deaminase n=1 Tax=Pseudoroseicyclus tamaricis TaxID=2705421 RepID=A0A6B2JWW7_9RHOB|nr:adenine deaminase C-terminal domain-containing protein [Pseudoroseicyclus tamaricis]NDV01159.1 adenine deaminase [Pseudoroseicyclus tamaricis]